MSPDSSKHQPAGRVLVAYVVLVFAAAALAAPAVYRAVRAAAVHLPLLAPLAAHPLHRYFDRLLLLFAVVGISPLLRRLGLRGRAGVGLAGLRAHRRALWRGAAFGAATVATAASLPLIAGVREVDPQLSLSRLVGRAALGVGVAVLVATLEETLFRGVIDGGLWRARASRLALAVSAAFYAGVHFLTRPGTPAEVTWASGLLMLGQMAAALADVDAVLPGFLTLWVAGLSLGALYRRTGALWAGIGVHGGAIFALQLYGVVVAPAGGAPDRVVWGTGRLIDGWVAFGVVLVATAVAWAALRRRAPRLAIGGPAVGEGPGLAPVAVACGGVR